MALLRLDKCLCDLGLGTRSEIRDWIRGGRVSVDGRVLRRPEEKLDPETAELELDGKSLRYRSRRYFMMDKPEGVITATEDAAQKTVLDLLPPEAEGRRMEALSGGAGRRSG